MTNIATAKNEGGNMKKIIYLMTIILFIFSSFGCGIDESRFQIKYLTVKDAIRILEENKVQVVNYSKAIDSDYIIKGKKPEIYKIKGTNNYLYFYSFKTIKARRDFMNLDTKNYLNQTYVLYYNIFPVKNLLMVFVGEDDKSIPNGADIKLLTKIGNIALEKMNDCKTVVYKGKKNNWQGESTLKYYEYYEKDSNGDIQREEYHVQNTKLQYLGENKKIASFTVEYNQPGGDGKLGEKSLELKKNQFINIGPDTGVGDYPRKQKRIFLKIKMDQETNKLFLKR